MIIGFIIGFLTSVDVQEIDKLGGNIINTNEGVNSKEIFRESPFRIVIGILFIYWLKSGDEVTDILQNRVKFVINIFYGESIGKSFTEEHKSKPEYWVSCEHDQRVLD